MALGFALWALVPGSVGAAAAATGERIEGFSSEIVVARDGTITVTETIAYNFGGATDRHGIFRDIPVRFTYDDRYDRLTPLTLVSVTAEPAGTPAGVAEMSEGALRRIRIGDADRTVSGRVTYRLTYRVKGALNTFESHEELFWNATGNGWEVPIERVAVSVVTPGGIGQVACYAGYSGSRLGCDGATSAGSNGRFNESDLSAGQGVTVVVAMPKGSVTVGPPILDERWSPQRAFAATPVSVGLSIGLTALIVFGLVRMAWARGRDRRWRGSQVDAVFGNEGGADEAVPLAGFSRPLDPVEFEPPEGILPGQLGTLIDEVANPLDVTATIVHLAVRGFLRIEEIPKEGWFGKADWRLVKLGDGGGPHAPEEDGVGAPSGAPKAQKALRNYERLLFDGLFQSGDQVELSDLKRTFATRLRSVQDTLYDDVVSAGWFAARPDRVRGRWVAAGIGLLVLSVAILIGLAALTHLGLLGIPPIVGSVMLLALANKMPRRTPKGVGMVRRVHGFRRLFTEAEAERARFAEQANLFSEYLPYAIVFGLTDRWARAFAGLDEAAAAAASAWYVGAQPFSLGHFGSSIDSFAVTSSGTIVATAASSGSSGFGGGGGSGGGFGGGGGGSW